MASDHEQIAELRAQIARMGIIIAGLRGFASRVIACSKHGPPPTIAMFNEIREACIVQAKNADVAGIPIQREAELLRQAINDLDKLLDSAIAQGWQA